MSDAREPGRKGGGNGREERKERGAPVGRAPARRVRERRHHHQREPTTHHGRTAVEALEGRTAAGCSHEVEAGHETRTGSDPDDRSGDQRELEALVQQEDAVPGDPGDDCDERDPLRADAVGAPAGRKLRGEGRDDEGSGQEPDSRNETS